MTIRIFWDALRWKISRWKDALIGDIQKYIYSINLGCELVPPTLTLIHAAVDEYLAIFSGQCIGFRCCCVLYIVSTGHLSRVFAESINMHLA